MIKDPEKTITLSDKYGTAVSLPLGNDYVIGIGNVDIDGFIRIDSMMYKPKVEKAKQTTILPQSEAHINGYELFHTKVTSSYGFGGQKSVFEYYKRDNDLSYYTLIRKEGKKPRKLQLGSLKEEHSRIFQVSRVIRDKFGYDQTAFDRGQLIGYLPKSLSGARILKSTLDILTKEEYLTEGSAPSGKRNRLKEVFTPTEKLVKFMSDPRSWQKTNGLNIGSLAMTSNQ